MPSTIRSADDGDRALRDHRALIDFLPRAVDALPLLRTGALNWLATAEAADPNWSGCFGLQMCSLEQQQRVRRDVRGDATGELPEPPPAARGARLLPATRRDVPGSWAPALAAQHRPEPPLPAELVDRGRMRRWFDLLGVPVPDGFEVDAAALDPAAAARRLGVPFVAQRPVGGGTYLVREPADLRAALAREPDATRWLFREHRPGTVLNLHGFVHLDGAVVVTRPSVQLTGIEQVGAEFARACGSDFAAAGELPEAVRDRAHRAAERIGSGLAVLGYRGIFGVDLVVQDHAIAVLELRARQQDSTWLLGELERAEGSVPLLVRHALERYGRPTGGTHSRGPSPAVQLTIRHAGPDGEVADPVRSGVYALRGDRLVWRRAGGGLLDCSEDELVVVGLPREGSALRPGATLGVVATRTALSSPDGQELTERGERVLAAFHALNPVAARERAAV